MRQPSLEAEFQSTIRRHQLRRPRKSKAQGRMSTNRLSRIVAIGNTARLRSVREPARHDEMLVVNSKIPKTPAPNCGRFSFATARGTDTKLLREELSEGVNS